MSKGRRRRMAEAERRRRRRTIASIAGGAGVIVIGVLIAVVVVGAKSGGTGSTNESKLTTGPKAPATTLKLLGGETVAFGKAGGNQTVALGFFLDNCAPCIEGMRTFAEVAKEADGKPVKAVALNLGPQGGAALADFGEQIGATGFDVANDGTAVTKLAQKLRVTTVDTNVVIDRRGRILAQGVGLSVEDQLDAIDQSLAS